MKKTFILLIIAFITTSCTSVKVIPLSTPQPTTHICIKENPKVIVPNFLYILQNRLNHHGINTFVFSGDIPPEGCQVIMTYTALQSWDFVTYLSHAELRLKTPEGKQLAYAKYHLVGKGGLTFTKYNSTESKMNPVIDDLLGK